MSTMNFNVSAPSTPQVDVNNFSAGDGSSVNDVKNTFTDSSSTQPASTPKSLADISAAFHPVDTLSSWKNGGSEIASGNQAAKTNGYVATLANGYSLASGSGSSANGMSFATSASEQNAEIKKAVKEFQSYTPGTPGITLAKALQGKSPQYQAELIKTLFKELPTNRVMNFFANSSGDKTVANALSNAYNYEATNGRGGAFLKTIIQKAAISGSGNSDLIGGLVTSSKNEKMISEYKTQSKAYANGLKGTDTATNAARANANASGTTAASGGLAPDFKKSILNGTLTDVKLKDLLKTQAGQRNIADILKAEAKNPKSDKSGLGNTLFLRVANLADNVTSAYLKDSMVDYFNKKGGVISENLATGETGRLNAKKISNFFENIVLQNSDYVKSIYSSEGGMQKSLDAAMSQATNPKIHSAHNMSAATGRMFGAMDVALDRYKGTTEGKTKIANTIADSGAKMIKGFVGKVPGAGFVVDKIVSATKSKVNGGLGETQIKDSKQISNKFWNKFTSAAEVVANRDFAGKGVFTGSDKIYSVLKSIQTEAAFFRDKNPNPKED